jgi:Tol biopolymer transport system component
MRVAVSPDHHQIAIDLLGSIWIVPFSGGDAKKITPDSLEAYSPTWSRDSRTIAFSALGDDGMFHIQSIKEDGSGLKQLTEGPYEDTAPVWAHESDRILFMSDRGGDVNTIWELSGHDVRRFAAGEAVHPTWSPHDDQVAYVTRNDQAKRWEVWTINAMGEQSLAGTDPVEAPWPSWNQYYDDFTIAGPRDWISRDQYMGAIGDKILLHTRGSRDSHPIDFTAKLKLKRADYEGRHRVLEPAEPQRLKGIVSPVVSHDGTKIAFTALGDLWVLPIGEQPFKVTDDANVDLDPSWAPDGTRLAFSTDRTGTMQLWMHDFRANIAVPITGLIKVEAEEGRVTGSAWSPDGTQIAFRRSGGWSVATAPGSTPGCRQGTTKGGVTIRPEGEVGRPTWIAYGCSIAYGALFSSVSNAFDGINQLLTHDLISARTTSVLVFAGNSIGDRRNSSPIWSPDGHSVAFVANGRLWTVPVDAAGKPTGPPNVVVDDAPDSPSWLPDNEHFIYVNPSGLRRTTGTGSESIASDINWAPSVPPDRIVVHAGQMFDGRNDGLRSNIDITIEHGVIRSVQDHADELHAGTVIDAAEQIVIPGLIDARIEIDPSYGESLGALLLAYGITSVRDVTLNTYAGLEMQEAIANGRRVGPRVFITGDPFDGRRVSEAGGVSVSSQASLEAALDRASQLGVDNFYARGRLAGSLEQRLVDYAHRRGLRTMTNSLFGLIAFGHDEIDRAARLTGDEAINIITKSGAFWAPLISENGGLGASVAKDPAILKDPRLELLPPLELAHHLMMAGVAVKSHVDYDKLMKPARDALAAAVKAGGYVIAGSDAGAISSGGTSPAQYGVVIEGSGIPLIPYGIALHTELEQFVAAGMTPFQALQTATVTAADAIGVADALGSIEVGKLGDLVFLGGNPLQDIKNTRDVRGVMRGGRFYDLASLGVTQQPAR